MGVFFRVVKFFVEWCNLFFFNSLFLAQCFPFSNFTNTITKKLQRFREPRLYLCVDIFHLLLNTTKSLPWLRKFHFYHFESFSVWIRQNSRLGAYSSLFICRCTVFLLFIYLFLSTQVYQCLEDTNINEICFNDKTLPDKCARVLADGRRGDLKTFLSLSPNGDIKF